MIIAKQNEDVRKNFNIHLPIQTTGEWVPEEKEMSSSAFKVMGGKFFFATVIGREV